MIAQRSELSSTSLPGRSTIAHDWIPAIIGTPVWVPIVVANWDSPRRSSESISTYASSLIPARTPVCSVVPTRCAHEPRGKLLAMTVGELAQELTQRRRGIRATEEPAHPADLNATFAEIS